MSRDKIKLAAILAALILAGVLIPGVARVATTSSPHQQGEYSALSTPEQVQHNGLDSQSESEPSGRQFGSPSGREFFYKMLLSALLVIVLGVSAIYVSKKLLPRFTNLPGKKIRILETAYIAPRKGIHLIQAGTRRLLIASTNETITMLADVTDSATDFAAELEARS
jgi:flagellar biogenesis protein FliO